MKPLDYTLYNRVKEKFPPQPGAVIFVSLAPENLEKLEGVVFTLEKIDDLFRVVNEHADSVIPYANIYSLEENKPVFYFGSPEFEQYEDLLTGKITCFSIGTYHNNPIDIEAVKKDLAKITDLTLFGGNA